MKNLLAGLSAPLLFVATLTAGGESDPVPLTLSWSLSLDASGNVTQLQPQTGGKADKLPQIRERLEQAIRTWKFVPGAIDGRAQATDTQLIVKVSAIAHDSNTLELRVDSAYTGGGIAKAVAPRYPVSAIRAHKTGLVVLRARYDAAGAVVSAEQDADSPKVDEHLISAATAATKTWIFKPEVVGGNAIAGWALIPFCFSVSGGKAPDCRWTPKGEQVALGDGDALALEPAAKLVTDVTGHTL